jgi:hypothetical protein
MRSGHGYGCGWQNSEGERRSTPWTVGSGGPHGTRDWPHRLEGRGGVRTKEMLSIGVGQGSVLYTVLYSSPELQGSTH